MIKCQNMLLKINPEMERKSIDVSKSNLLILVTLLKEIE